METVTLEIIHKDLEFVKDYRNNLIGIIKIDKKPRVYD
jgi:hypothetical protein